MGFCRQAEKTPGSFSEVDGEDSGSGSRRDYRTSSRPVSGHLQETDFLPDPEPARAPVCAADPRFARDSVSDAVPADLPDIAGPIGRLRRYFLVSIGVVSVILGLVGTVVPLLPTTPFLLLAAACFLRSSSRLHRALYDNRVFGPYLRRYASGEGLPPATRIVTIGLLWATLAISAFAVVPPRLWWVRIVLFAIGVGVTIHILRIGKRRRK